MKVCKFGLEKIWIDFAEGAIRMCGWTDYRIGNLSEDTIENLWNGEKARKFRESMLDGSYRFCMKHECPYWSNDMLEYVEYEKPEYPKAISLSYEESCNYVCKFCRNEPYVRLCDENKRIARIEHEIKKFIHQLKEISANGAGEFFCSPSIMRIFGEIKDSQNIKIFLESNGSLFNFNNWRKIENIGKHWLKVTITVHSFQENTYQFLSGTKLPVQNVIDNLSFISNLRDRNIINEFELATVICERNFRELPEFVKFSLDKFKLDKIRLRFFYPYGVMDRQTEWFYDIRNPYHPYYCEFKKIIEDPIFQNDKVWKWQGENLSIQKESPYILEHRNYLNISELIVLDNVGKRIEKYLCQERISRVALYGGGKGGKAYFKILQAYGMKINMIFDTYEEERKTVQYEIVRPTEDRIREVELIIVTQETLFQDIERILMRMHYQGRIERMENFISDLKEIDFLE